MRRTPAATHRPCPVRDSLRTLSLGCCAARTGAPRPPSQHLRTLAVGGASWRTAPHPQVCHASHLTSGHPRRPHHMHAAARCCTLRTALPLA
eukprot:1849179-Pyramimonas_sp.AAC.1